MNKMGKLSTILLIAIMCILVIYQVLAVPQMPHQFYGSVTIAGDPAPNGTLVEAKIAGVTYENGTTVDGKYGYEICPLFPFYVPADDPETPEKDGGVNGDTIDFYVAGTYATSYAFEIGGITKLDLATEVPAPYADFVASVTSGNEPLTVIFTDKSANFDSITSWNWSFGDGGTSDLQNPMHTYEQNGTYTVSLTVVGVKDGEIVEDTETKTDYIQVFDTEPVADFTATPTSGPAPLEVNFTDASTSYDGIVSWSWSFGDDGTSTEQNPTHVYESDGTYTVTLTVAEADGDADTETKTDYITVTAVLPPSIVSFDPPYSTVSNVEGASRTFSITVDQVVDVSWLMNATEVYSDPGVTFSSYTNTSAPLGVWNVSAVASNVNGMAMQTWTWNVTTVLPPPHADFIANVTGGDEPLTVAFTDLSEYFGVITSWEWDFDNDGVIDSTEENPVHTYVQNGTYTVSLTVVGELGTDSENKTDYIEVFDTEPVAGFSATPTIGSTPLTVQFTDASTSYDNVTSWSWDFGDNATSSEQNPVHVYDSEGTYTVSLTVTEADGDTDTETKVNYITVTVIVGVVDVTIDVGSIHFRGEIAEFYILTVYEGTQVDVGFTKLGLWYYNGVNYSYVDLTTFVDKVEVGLYRVYYEIPIDAPAVTYTFIANVNYTTPEGSAYGASVKAFELSPTLTGWNAWLTDIKDNVATIKTDVGIIKMNITELNATITSIEGKIVTISSKIGDIETDLKSINATLVTIQGDVAVIKTDVGTIKADLDTINATLVGIDEGVAYIKTAIDDVELKLDLLNITVINATLVEIKEGLASINSTIGSIETSLTSINAKLVALNGTIATISSDIGSIQVSIDDINLKVVAINGTVATIETDVGTIKGTVTAIDGNVATIETDIGTLQTTVEDIKPVTGIVVPIWFAVVFSLIAAVFAIATLIWRRRSST